MTNLAKEYAIEQSGGDIKSLLGTLGQTAAKEEIPPEMLDMLSQLPDWVNQRAGALERIKLAYDEDPRMQMSPAQAHGRAMFNNPNIGDMGYSLAAGEQARNDHAEYLRKSKIDREKAVLDALDLGTFDKLYSTVQKNLTKSGKGASVKGYSGHTVDGGSYVLNNDTGKAEWIKAPVGATKFKGAIMMDMAKKSMDQGTYDDAMQKKIFENSDKWYQEYLKYTPEMQSQVEQQLGIAEELPKLPPIPGVNVSPGSVKPGTTVNLGDPAIPGSGNFTPEQLAAIKADVAKDKTLLPHGSIVQPASPSVNASAPMFKTPEQLKFEETGGKNWADEIPKLAESIKANEAKVRHFAPMESMLLSGNLPSGPLHEYLKVVGDFASTYDPQGTLAKRYGNDTPAYFGELMNLVRSDIKALGAGTAVSNLDLIVSQMAAGDLRNSPQGNLKLIGLQKYAAMEKAAYDKKYMKTIQDTGRGTDFVTGKKQSPEYAIRRKPNAKGLEAYVVIPRSQYEKEFEAKFKKKPSQSQWEDYSKNSIGMMFSGEDYVKQ